jgi:hypothetical protein
VWLRCGAVPATRARFAKNRPWSSLIGNRCPTSSFPIHQRSTLTPPFILYHPFLLSFDALALSNPPLPALHIIPTAVRPPVPRRTAPSTCVYKSSQPSRPSALSRPSSSRSWTCSRATLARSPIWSPPPLPPRRPRPRPPSRPLPRRSPTSPLRTSASPTGRTSSPPRRRPRPASLTSG